MSDDKNFRSILGSAGSEVADASAPDNLIVANQHAKVRDLQKRLFGRKGESRRGSEVQAQASVVRAPRGHLRGVPARDPQAALGPCASAVACRAS